tara:strand:- start:3992 stop:5677 length:1686 start_codon:yes stop_codon:yes gene_type:complete
MGTAFEGFMTGFMTEGAKQINARTEEKRQIKEDERKSEAALALQSLKDQQADDKARNTLFEKTRVAEEAKAGHVQTIMTNLGIDGSRKDEITGAYDMYGGTSAQFMAAYNKGNITFDPTAPPLKNVVDQTEGALSPDVRTNSYVGFNVNPTSNKGKTIESATLNYAEVKNDPNATPEEIQAARDEYQSLIDLRANQKIIDNIDGAVTLKVQGEDGITLLHNVTQKFTPEGLVYTDPQGNIVENAVVLPEEEKEAVAAVLKSVSIPTKDYNQTLLPVSRVTSLAGDLIGIVDESPLVLAGFTTGVARKIQGAKIELQAAQDVLSGMFEDRGSNGEDAYVTLKEFEESMLPNGVSLDSIANAEYNGASTDSLAKLAHAGDKFSAKMILMAFRAGGIEGQVGMAMSNKDFERLKDVVASSKDPQTFKTQLAEYVSDGIGGLNRSASLVNNDPKIRGFRNLYNYDPLLGESLVQDFDTLVRTSEDERFKTGAALIAQYSGTATTDTGEQTVVTSDPVTSETDLSLVDVINSYNAGDTILITDAIVALYPDMAELLGKSINNGSDK